MNSKIFLTAVSLAMVGCVSAPPKGTLDPTTVEVRVSVPYECGEAPPSLKFIARPVVWEGAIVLEDGTVAYPLPVGMYQNLGLNTSDLKEAAIQIKKQRDFYVACIERSKEKAGEELE